MFPDGDAAAAVELAESQLHVEERDTSKHCHQQVGQQKGTWAETQGRRELKDGDEKQVRREGEKICGKDENSGKSKRGETGRKKELWTNSKKSITLMRNATHSHSIL